VIKPIHPFPARMAPELAVTGLRKLAPHSLVLDPMAGSGTVLREASELRHRAIGFDLDPLAVLMARVWTTPIDDKVVLRIVTEVTSAAKALSPDIAELPWIDSDGETRQFVNFWFGSAQQADLRRLSCAIAQLESVARRSEAAAINLLKIALSRIIITKERGASLARDVSHSRPHKVAESSTFDVFSAFERSVHRVRKQLLREPPPRGVEVSVGDARQLKDVGNSEVDAVLTSPPYLNAIDYMRGHRLSLVWLGHSLSELRRIRSISIGTERGLNVPSAFNPFAEIKTAMVAIERLPTRYARMVERYGEDMYRLMSQISRVLKPSGKAILVVGNSCLTGVFIRNADGIATAASMVGLKLKNRVERDLPSANRYLPIPDQKKGALGKRIRTETILSFVHA